MKHQVKTEWQDGMHFKSSTNLGSIELDADESFGGQGKGMRSKPLMLSSLAGCTGMDVRSLITKMRLEVDQISIDVTAELTDVDPKIYKRTHITYTFSGTNLNEDKLTKAVNLSFEKYCGVVAMFRHFSEVTKEIVFNRK